MIDKKDFLAILAQLQRIANALEESNKLNQEKLIMEKKKYKRAISNLAENNAKKV